MEISKKIDILNRFKDIQGKNVIQGKGIVRIWDRLVLTKLLLTNAKKLIKSYDLVEFFVYSRKKNTALYVKTINQVLETWIGKNIATKLNSLDFTFWVLYRRYCCRTFKFLCRNSYTGVIFS